MKTNLILICFALVFLCIIGCPDDGRVGPTRTACGMNSGSDGKSVAWFQYYDYGGSPIDQPGLRMDYLLGTPFYFVNNGLGGLDAVNTDYVEICTTGVTEEGGMCYGRGSLTESGAESGDAHLSRMGAYFRKPKVESCECSGEMVYGAIPAKSYTVASASSCSTAPKWVQKTAFSSAMLTDKEKLAVSGPPVDIPESGLTYSLSLVQQRGNVGAGYAVEMTGLVASDIDDMDNVFFRSYPMQYSYTVKTAEPIELMGRQFSSLVKTNICPTGYTVPVTVIAENEEKTVHIARTEFFIPTEPESFAELTADGATRLAVYDRWTPVEGVDYNDPNTIYGTPLDIEDPNCIADDRIRECYIIPINEENDELRIQFVIPTDELVLLGASEWLGMNRCLDINNDGIVNFSDLLGLN